MRIKDSQRYHTRFRLLELEERIELTDAIEIHFIELPKLKEEMAQNWGHSCAQVCPLSLLEPTGPVGNVPERMG